MLEKVLENVHILPKILKYGILSFKIWQNNFDFLYTHKQSRKKKLVTSFLSVYVLTCKSVNTMAGFIDPKYFIKLVFAIFNKHLFITK